MDRKELIKKYIEFFKRKDHKEIPNASLIPENDPTVLFTTAGMHPLVPFLLGQPHPLGKRLCNVQKCIRTQDIDEVGDSFHHTFFEMLGNWSLGDYFKEDAIKFSFEFLTKILKIPVGKLAVSCFAGDENVGKDEESAGIWRELGIDKKRIAFLPKKDNWWGPAGKTGPCGPDSEMFYWTAEEEPPESFDVSDKRWVEIWNDVFMQYNKTEKGFEELKQKNVDTGMGVERTLAVLNNLDDDYMTDSFFPLIKKIEQISKKDYEGNKKEFRIIADHLKAATMILGEKITPGNKEQGYVLRKLIRRAVRYGLIIGLEENFTKKIAEETIEIYSDYSHLKKNKDFILKEIEKEESRFRENLKLGLKYFDKIVRNKKEISGKDAFLLYQSYGFPLEMTLELAGERGIGVRQEEFKEEMKKHQELSRTATQGKFKSGLADNSEKTTRLHTATHLLNQALREVLGGEIYQKGSNITAERLRFDFNFDRKLTDEEIKRIEEWVNDKIEKELPVTREEMTLNEAKKAGAKGFFEDKYGEKVFVYFIGDKENPVSVEICAGPHVKNTKELGKFKIKKQESVSAGVRRIKAVLEKK